MVEALLEATLKTDFGPLYEALAQDEDLGVDAITPEDRIFTRGTQDYARGKQAGSCGLG